MTPPEVPGTRTGANHHLWFAILGLAAGAGLGALILSYNGTLSLRGAGASAQPTSSAGAVVGEAAPDFSLATTDGELIQLSGLRGSPVLINFWATWCAPCRLEMPAIQDRYEQFYPALQVLAVNFDESDRQVRDFMQELNLDFPALLDPGGVVNRELYRVRGYPTSIFVDAAGIVRVVHIGIMTEGQLDGYLEQVGLD